MAASIPHVEIADDRHAHGVGRPDREMHAGNTFMNHRVRTDVVIKARVRALSDQPVVQRAEHGTVGIRVVDRPRGVLVRGPQQVGAPAWQLPFEKTRRIAASEVRQKFTFAGCRRDFVGARDERPEETLAVFFMDAEHGERVAIPTLDNGCNHARRRRRRFRPHVPPGITFQISLAYSRIARSDENHPTRDVLRTAALHHAAGLRQYASTRCCANR